MSRVELGSSFIFSSYCRASASGSLVCSIIAAALSDSIYSSEGMGGTCIATCVT